MGRDMHTTRDFLEFLIDGGLLEDEQALYALDRQRAMTPPIGRIVLLTRRMTMKQVVATLGAQLDTGYRFGEQAIALGFLSSAELDAVLAEQERARPAICQVLAEMGAATPAEIERYRVRFVQSTAALLG